MEAPGSWSLDSAEDGFEKMESGLNAKPRDFVRFGLLYAHEGRVGDRQVLPADWVAISTAPKVAPDYGYFWWVDTASPTEAFAARGNLGQLIYVVPDEDLVIVRFGERRGDVDWLALARSLARQIRSREG